jgi:GT2 family glycosyltransferase
MNHIATLITCYNRKDKTLICLDMLMLNSLPVGYSMDVYLVDDGCTDGTSQAIHSCYPQVNIIKGDGNLFWNRGMHKAWETAAKAKDYDYYLWLNDDTFLFKNALEVMLSAILSTENQSIIVAASCSKVTGMLTYSGFLSNGDRIKPIDKLVKAHTFHGNCVLIPKLVFQKVGNLDPLFHHSIGDMDYGLRATKFGIKSLVAPGFLASCEEHDSLPLWCIPSASLIERIKSLYSPLGNNQPYYYFRFKFRHFGFLIALKHLVSMHLRLFFPALWLKLKGKS